MLRSLLIALDGSPGSDLAFRTAVHLARTQEAIPTGLVFLTSMQQRARELGTGPSTGGDDLQSLLDQYRDTAKSMGLGEVDIRAADGDPVHIIEHQSTSHDMVVMGRHTLLNPGGELYALSTALERLIQRGHRPLLVVPEAAGSDWFDGPVIIGFDGSPAASRSLHLFSLLALGRGRRHQVVTVLERSGEPSAAIAEGASVLLERHGARQVSTIVERGEENARPAQAILQAAEAAGAGLVVMGGYGHRGIREILGSSAREVLGKSAVPLFLHH
jgi:nucleotide-binding universal stress UspA family protein